MAQDVIYTGECSMWTWEESVFFRFWVEGNQKDLQKQIQNNKNDDNGIDIDNYLKYKYMKCKRHGAAKWIQKQDPCICYLQETHFVIHLFYFNLH